MTTTAMLRYSFRRSTSSTPFFLVLMLAFSLLLARQHQQATTIGVVVVSGFGIGSVPSSAPRAATCGYPGGGGGGQITMRVLMAGSCSRTDKHHDDTVSETSLVLSGEEDQATTANKEEAISKNGRAWCRCRRSFLRQAAATATTAAPASLMMTQQLPEAAQAAVGTLPEFANTNAILQGITISVSDQSQQNSMIKFLEDGFDCEILRKRISGSVEETWLGFGPEQLSIPKDFTLPVSNFKNYGGHASIHIVYDSKRAEVLYRTGGGENPPPGDNIAYIQFGVPQYRISQMVANGGNILDAYGIVNVISPAGLPIRGIVGIAPDPIMFIAINCIDVDASKQFYIQQLGFVEQQYPYCRPNSGQGQFEPPQPPNSVYLAPSENCMGILLLPKTKKGLLGREQPATSVTPNPVIQSLDIVYNPSSTDDSSTSNSNNLRVVDPSGVGISFTPVRDFEATELRTR